MINSRFTSAQQVFEAFPTMAGDLTSGPSEAPPLDFLDALKNGASPEDAIGFAAYLLNRRQAVWWGCQSIRKLGSPRDREEEVAILTAEAWVREPEEHRRLAALDLGFNGSHRLPGVLLAMAAGGAGGHLGTAEQPGPPAPAHMTAKAVRAAVLGSLAMVPIRERGAKIAELVGDCRALLEKA